MPRQADKRSCSRATASAGERTAARKSL